MRIGIDITSTQDQYKRRGIGRYCKSIVENLLKIDQENSYLLFKYEDEISILEHAFLTYKNIKVESIGKFHLASPKYYFSNELGNKIKGAKLDAFLYPNIERPIRGDIPSVVMIHDVIPLSNNIFSYKGKVFNIMKKRWYLRNLKRVSKANKIITNSNFSKSEIEKVIKREDVIAIPLGIEEKFFNVKTDRMLEILKKYQLEFEYVIYYGGNEVNKNVLGLLKSWKAFKDLKTFKEIKLVLVGSDYKNLTKDINIQIQDYIKNNSLEDSIFYINYIEDNDLPFIIKGGRCFINLSLIEGFGFTVLENAASGVPLIVSDIPIYREILKDCAIFVDPNNSKLVADKINNILKSDNSSIIEKEIERAKIYTWQSTARKTLKVLESL